MDIYGFFNSPDVAEHCRSIWHKWGAVESAVMVSKSKTRSLEEKHAAYRDIIREYPDMEIPKGGNHSHINSFHKALKDIIKSEARELEKYLANELNTAYELKIRGDSWGLFAGHEQALSGLLEYLDDIEYCDRPGEEIKPIDPVYASIKKKYLHENNGLEYIEASVTLSGEIFELSMNARLPDTPEECYLLEDLYIDVPIPFKKGDLVETDYSNGYMGSVFVLKCTCRDDAEQNAKNILYTDTSDMTAEVYYESDGNIDCDCIHFYPDLRYCRSELTGERRILKYVSLYMQNKICLCSLLKIQKYLLLAKKMGELRSNYGLGWQLKQIGDKLLKE